MYIVVLFYAIITQSIYIPQVPFLHSLSTPEFILNCFRVMFYYFFVVINIFFVCGRSNYFVERLDIFPPASKRTFGVARCPPQDWGGAAELGGLKFNQRKKISERKIRGKRKNLGRNSPSLALPLFCLPLFPPIRDNIGVGGKKERV